MEINGFPMRIRGEDERNLQFKGAIQLRLDGENTEILRAVEKYLDKNEGKKEEHKISESLDKLSNEKVNKLYDKLKEKLSKIYKNRPANPIQKICDNQEMFQDSDD